MNAALFSAILDLTLAEVGSARARYDAGFRVLQDSLLCFFQYYHVRYIIYPAECFFGLAPMHTQINAAQLATSP